MTEIRRRRAGRAVGPDGQRAQLKDLLGLHAGDQVELEHAALGIGGDLGAGQHVLDGGVRQVAGAPEVSARQRARSWMGRTESSSAS